MSTPAPAPEWTLSAKHTNGTGGQLLAGCHIIKNDTDTAYLFTQPNTNDVLASSPGTSLPTSSFTFTPAFNYNGLTDCVITMKTPVPAGTNWKGQWSATDTPVTHVPLPTGPQGGDFTAQAGSGLGEDEASSSAKA